MRRVALSFAMAGWFAALGVPSMAQAETYDLVILGGRVMDPETGFDQVANVGVNGNQIAVVTKNEISGKETIDAKGLVVAPGFH